ncbi:hypothetical protein QJQ45_017083 [Haematococcus lacustris]|nr:hypothetical protein QJQ45_017083 [Haematococcus lacustris]
MVDMRLKKVIIACVLCWATVSCSNMTTGQCQHTDPKRLSPEQQRLIDRFFALFVATSGVPYAVCKNKWLKRALTEAGADTLSPKRLKTTLDTLYEETRLEKDAELKELLQAGVGVMSCTDGWRHRRAGHAHPLLNLVLLKPSGGCYFYDCFPLDKGAKKTAQFYADMHENLAMKVTGGDPKLLLGVIMDSPSTNRAALRLLERKYPSWICMTCCVHAMNLICKDLANENKTESKHTAVGGFLKQASCRAPTCWWKKLDAVVRLMQPISNAIHRLEGDHPTLSQVMRIWADLVEHAKTWAAGRGDPDGEDKVDSDFVRGVHKLFKNRATKHYQPVMAVARLLDPINFKYLNHVEQPYPDFEILTETQRVELEPTIARLAEVPIGLVQAELSRFENTDWSPAMKRRALSILSIQQPPGRAVIHIASINARKAFWSVTAAKDFPVLAKAAVKLLSVHVSTAAAERNWSMWSLTYSNALRSKLGVETAKRDIYLKANVEEMDEERDNTAPPQETLINILA